MPKLSTRRESWLWPSIVAILLLANATVAIFFWWSLSSSKQLFDERAYAQTANIASTLDGNISSSIEKIDLVLASVADELEREIRAGGIQSDQALRFLARRLQNMPELPALRVYDAEGNGLVNEGVKPAADVVNIADRDYFQRAKAQTEPERILSPLLRSRVDQSFVIVSARRFVDAQGRFAGVVIAPIGVEYFSQLIYGLDLGSAGTVALRDADQRLIARNPPLHGSPAGEIGNRIVSKEFQKLIDAGVETGNFHNADGAGGIDRVVSMRRLHAAPFLLAVGLASQDYLRGWYGEIAAAAALVFCFAITSVLLGLTLRRATQATLQASLRNRLYLKRASDGIMVLDGKGRLNIVNDRLCELLGLSREQLVAMSRLELLQLWPDKRARANAFVTLRKGNELLSLETLIRKGPAGEMRDVELNASAFEIAGEPCYYISVRDISERKAIQDQIREMAYLDQLTQLPNRRLLSDRLELAIAASQRSRQFCALMMLDLDKFKRLNDQWGHDAGDQLLIEVARRMKNLMRGQDTVARMGGDEFVVLLSGLGEDRASAATNASLIATKILEALNTPVALGEGAPDWPCHCSIGISLFVGHDCATGELFKQADLALYEAKHAGGDGFKVFTAPESTPA